MATIIQYMDDERPADTKIVLNVTGFEVGDIFERKGVLYRAFMVEPLCGNIYVYCLPEENAHDDY
jgi:hypothetical protein